MHTFAYIYIYIYIYIHASGWNIDPQRAPIHKVYNTQLRLRNIEDKERVHHNDHFQEELESLKASVGRIATLLEQALSFYSYYRGDTYKCFHEEANQKKDVSELKDKAYSYSVQKVIAFVWSCLQKCFDFVMSVKSNCCVQKLIHPKCICLNWREVIFDNHFTRLKNHTPH